MMNVCAQFYLLASIGGGRQYDGLFQWTLPVDWKSVGQILQEKTWRSTRELSPSKDVLGLTASRAAAALYRLILMISLVCGWLLGPTLRGHIKAAPLLPSLATKSIRSLGQTEISVGRLTALDEIFVFFAAAAAQRANTHTHTLSTGSAPAALH